MGGRGYIWNHVHLASDYLTEFQAAGLDVVRCIEPLWGEREIATFPFADDFRDMLDAAVKGMPIVIAWELEKRACFQLEFALLSKKVAVPNRLAHQTG